MKTLYIDRKDSCLQLKGGRFTVQIAERRANFSVPTSMLDTIVISANVTLSSTLITRLTQADVSLIFLNARSSEASTLTLGLMHNNARIRLQQYQYISSPAQRCTGANALVVDKLRAQRVTLYKASQTRPDCRHALVKGIQQISSMLESLQSAPSELEALRGIEGSAAACYFKALQSIFPPGLNFTGRNRRPPRDPVNVILSLTYSMLHAEAIRTLFGVGFDPLLGVFHEPSYGRESLACDLVELFRPFADQWIWRLFADEYLRQEHFSDTGGPGESACMLGKRGRELYFAAYEIRARAWRRLMRRVARHWVNNLPALSPSLAPQP